MKKSFALVTLMALLIGLIPICLHIRPAQGTCLSRQRIKSVNMREEPNAAAISYHHPSWQDRAGIQQLYERSVGTFNMACLTVMLCENFWRKRKSCISNQVMANPLICVKVLVPTPEQ